MDFLSKRALLCLFISIFFFIHGGHGQKLMGCYRDISFTTRLLESKTDFSGQLTVETCINSCKGKGYQYAGVEFKTECFCSNIRPSYKYLVDDEDCNLPCDGNSQQTCGGVYRLNVYDIEGKTQNQVADLYYGCFEDSEPNRLLPTPRKISNVLTPEYCVGYCFRRGYKFAGLENGNECFCGDSIEERGKDKTNECSISCPVETSMKCGGFWRISVYKTGITDLTIQKKNYLGCFQDSESPRLLRAVMSELKETNTPERCLNICLSQGFQYSGTEYSSQCFCGNTRPTPTTGYGEDKCNMICPGDNKQFCGGNWSIQVYSSIPVTKV